MPWTCSCVGSYLDLLTPTQVGLYNWTRQQVLVYSLAGLVSGAETGHQTVSLPATTAAIALVPGAVIAGSNELSGPVRAFPDSGGAATTVLSSGDGAALARPRTGRFSRRVRPPPAAGVCSASRATPPAAQAAVRSSGSTGRCGTPA